MSDRQEKDKFADARQHMLTQDLKGRDITDPRVLKVMAHIPREEFVPHEYYSQAYSDGPLPIGMGQTISQPYIVALMTQELRVDHNCEVLEVGTGSGYQTAVLSQLAKRVCTIEKFKELSESAQKVLDKLDITNVEFLVGDGSCGWPKELMPKKEFFDRIILTAAVPAIPEPLIEQFVDGGLIVAPVGYAGVQELVVVEKRTGNLIERNVCGCRFVKLIGKYGFEQ